MNSIKSVLILILLQIATIMTDNLMEVCFVDGEKFEMSLGTNSYRNAPTGLIKDASVAPPSWMSVN